MRFAALGLGLVMIGAGCAPVMPATVIEKPASEAPKVPAAPIAAPKDTKMTGDKPAAKQAVYEDFTQDKYAAALAAHEPIFLFFYAAWCPYCREQDPRVVEVFKNYEKSVHGFRVNYDAEKELKKKFGVYTQHTLIWLDANGQEVKKVIGTVSNEVLTTNLNAIAK